jgi:hypothetical protein
MDKKKMVGLVSIAIAISVGLYVRKVEYSPCVQLRADLELSEKFCVGIGKKFSKKNCDANGVDEKNMKSCVDLLTQVIASDCLSSLDLEDEISKYESFCQ